MDPVFICGPRARHADSSQKGQKRGYCEPCHQAAHVPCVAAYLARPQDGPARYRADHLARCETEDPQCRAARGACLGLRGRRGGIRHIHDRKGAPSVSFSTWPQTAPTTRRIRARNPGNPSRKPTKVLNRIQARPFQPQCADRGRRFPSATDHARGRSRPRPERSSPGCAQTCRAAGCSGPAPSPGPVTATEAPLRSCSPLARPGWTPPHRIAKHVARPQRDNDL